MTGVVLVDVAISLIFLYLVLSLMCSALQEVAATSLSTRSKNLWRGIENLLNDSGTTGPGQGAAAAGAAVEDESLAAKVYRHPLIKKLARDGKKPSYIPARTFALALLDTIKDPNAEGGALAEAATSVSKLPDGDIKTALTTLIVDAQGDAEKTRRNIETWFDDSMDRVAGWYKRHSHYWMIIYAFAIAVALNVDTLQVVRALYDNPEHARRTAAQAETFYESARKDVEKVRKSAEGGDKAGADINETLDENLKKLQELKGALDKSAFAIGWRGPHVPETIGSFLLSVPGWLLTALAVSLGAPFWFDMLGKLLSIRGTGVKPEKSKSP